MKKKLVAVLALAAVGVGAIYVSLGGLPAQAAATTQYLTATATTGDVTDDVAATGTLESTTRYGLVFGAAPYLVTDSSTAPQVSATYPVTKVEVKVGDTVRKDQVLATADTTDLERQLASARNSVESARVSLNAANATRSTANDSGNADQIRQAKIGQLNAQNQLADAQQQARDLQAQIIGATLKAPVDGLVTEVDVQAGFDAPSGNAIVIDGAGFQITTDVVESDLGDLAVGQQAAVSITAIGAEVTGKVSAISPVADSSSSGSSSVVSYPVTVTLDSVPAKARSGMTADVTITIASATNVLTVPAEALRGSQGDYRVLTLDANGQPVSTPVTVGLVTSTTAEIKSGIDAGTAVVTGTSSSRTGTTTTNGGGFGGFGVGGGGPVFQRGGNGGGSQTKP
jgi:membrane fusion protein, macrolide-specific efflux system